MKKTVVIIDQAGIWQCENRKLTYSERLAAENVCES